MYIYAMIGYYSDVKDTLVNKDQREYPVGENAFKYFVYVMDFGVRTDGGVNFS